MERFNSRVRKLSKFWEPLVGLAALITIPVLFIESRFDSSKVLIVNAVIWTVFTAELVSILAVCENKAERLAWLRRSWLDILIILGSIPILPSSLQSLRVLRIGKATRLIRILRLGRVFALGWVLRWAKSRFRLNPLMFSGTATIIVIFLGANAFHILEPQVAPDLGSAMWWAFTTCSTVGYGDLAPKTGEGKIVGVCLMIVGVAAMAAFSGSLASYLIQHQHEEEVDKLDTVLDELRDLREQVARLQSENASLVSERGQGE